MSIANGRDGSRNILENKLTEANEGNEDDDCGLYPAEITIFVFFVAFCKRIQEQARLHL